MNVTQDIINERKRIPQIEFLRFIMVLVVVFYHRYGDTMSRGFLAVEFFFILTGYLAMKSISKRKSEILTMSYLSQFIKRKIAVFYPELLIVSMGGCLFSLYLHLMGKYNFAGFVSDCLTNIIQNLALLRMSGIAGTSALCVPAWYLSSMIIALIIVLPFIFHYKNPIFHLVVALFLYSFILYNLEGLEKHSFADWVHFTYGGNLRAVAGILLGSVSYNIVEWLKSYQFRGIQRIIISTSLFFMAGLLFVILFYPCGKYDGIAVLIHFSLIIACFSNLTPLGRFFNNDKVYSFCCKLGAFSLPLYLGHIYPLYFYSTLSNPVLYLICAFFSGLIIAIAASYFRKFLSNKSQIST